MGGVGETARPIVCVEALARHDWCGVPLEAVQHTHQTGTGWGRQQHGHDSCRQMPSRRDSATGEECSQSWLASGRWSARPFTFWLNCPACANSLCLPVAIQATCTHTLQVQRPSWRGLGSACRQQRGPQRAGRALPGVATPLSPLTKGKTERSKGATWPAACRRPTTQ